MSSTTAGRPGAETGVAQCGQICQSASSGLLHFTHACFSRVVQTGQTRNVASTAARHTGQCRSRLESLLLHGADLQLALADVLDVLGRAEEEIDDRADEGRDEAEDGRHRHEPRILHAPARILVDPVGSREPEDGDEEDGQVADDHPGAGVEEVVDSSEQVVVGCRRGEDHRSSIPTK